MNETPKTTTAAELLATEFPPESREEAYRRGYRDGFVVALEELYTATKKANRGRETKGGWAAYLTLWDFWETGALHHWARDPGLVREALTDADRHERPPAPPPSR